MHIALGFVLVLGVLILVHEWGHFIVARFFGVRVDVFSIGFGPRLFGFKWGQTDWRISAFPLGGYVRMAGQDITEIDSGDKLPTGAPDELLTTPCTPAVFCAHINCVQTIAAATNAATLKPECLDMLFPPSIRSALSEAALKMQEILAM